MNGRIDACASRFTGRVKGLLQQSEFGQKMLASRGAEMPILCHPRRCFARGADYEGRGEQDAPCRNDNERVSPQLQSLVIQIRQVNAQAPVEGTRLDAA